jgi:hypothetical protein
MRDHVSEPGETRWLGAGNMVACRRDFERLGGFDGTLEACEDVDPCASSNTGGVLVNAPGMFNRHFGDPATLRALFRGELAGATTSVSACAARSPGGICRASSCRWWARPLARAGGAWLRSPGVTAIAACACARPAQRQWGGP